MANGPCDLKKPAENLENAHGRLTLGPLNPGDPRYLDCAPVRGINVVQKLETALRLHKGKNFLHQLFTGYRGDGKSTEIKRFIGNIEKDYLPLYFNAETEFDLLDFTFPDFLLGIATVLFHRMKEEKLYIPEELLEKVADWFATIVETVERKEVDELKVEAGVGIPNWFSFLTGRLVSTIKAGGQRRQEIRKELNLKLTHLIIHVDNLLAAAIRASEERDNRKLVLIFDSLDRLQPNLAFDLFYTNGQKLSELSCHFVYVVPLALLYEPKAPQMPFPDNPIIMKMIPVRDRQGKPDKGNLAHLKKLLKLRLVPKKIMTDPEKTMEDFIWASGGHLRDLVRLFRQACADGLCEPEEKITPKVAQRVINELCETYQKSIGYEDYKHLIETFTCKDVKSNEVTRRLIFDNLILVYDDNGKDWYDVHPVLSNGTKFQERLQAHGRG